ncbi:hypothetical protein ALC56_13258, partial [Trachymyrmex septentrionalis]
VFINTYMDFRGGTVLWICKHTSVIQISNEITIKDNLYQNESINQNQESSTNLIHLSPVVKINDISVGNLFYDGAWQKPIKGMYWKHNDSLWANATHTDIKKCYQSAKKGLKTWSNISINARVQKFVLAAMVEKWIKFAYLYKNIQGYIENEMIEVLFTRKALDVIILRQENENILFFRLMQTLIAGNSVIVIFDANFCNPSSYYDMFSKCGMPPGVINLLSHENISTLESKLYGNYTMYANRYFLKGTSLDAYIGSFKNLTTPKVITIPLQ